MFFKRKKNYFVFLKKKFKNYLFLLIFIYLFQVENKSDPNFLSFIQYYIDYFNNNSYQYEKNEFSKTNHSKEMNDLRNENQFLKQQLEKYDFKIKEISSTKKNIHNEVSSYKKRDEENQNVYNKKNLIEENKNFNSRLSDIRRRRSIN